MINKDQVWQHFHRASSSYDEVAGIQSECAALLTDLLERALPDFAPSSILDLGTGTGNIPELLVKKFPASLYSLNDIASGMLERTAQKFGVNDQFSFILGDMERVDFLPHDLIISNFALQWVDDFETTIAKLYKKSEVLTFSCLLDGTFEEWRKIFEEKSLPIPTYQYPSQVRLEKFLLSLRPEKYSFEAKDYKVVFPNALSFMRHLKQLGASTPNHAISLCDLRELIVTNDQEIAVTYKVFFCILARSSLGSRTKELSFYNS